MRGIMRRRGYKDRHLIKSRAAATEGD
uniref:Uncharacterized protein n=1 Tax=Anguilla anguilla TaxID=7936 RepID=A0A0E9R755_ANGAN